MRWGVLPLSVMLPEQTLPGGGGGDADGGGAAAADEETKIAGLRFLSARA